MGPLKSLADDAGHVDAGKKDGADADEAAADADAEAAAVDALADGPLAGVDGVPADADKRLPGRFRVACSKQHALSGDFFVGLVF